MIWKWIKYGRRFVEKCRKDNVSAYAAQSAFFLLLSLIPFLMVFSSMLQYTVVSKATLMKLIQDLTPEYIAPFLISILNEVYHKPIGIVSATAIAGIWSAAKGVEHVAAGLNVIHGVKETRNFLCRRFWAVVYTAVLMVSVVAALALLVFGNGIHQILIKQAPLFSHATKLLFELRSVFVLGIMSCIFTILYKTLPNRKQMKKHKITLKNQFPGAVLCSFGWYLFSSGISIYLNYFNGFSIYGSLTTIVLLMLWLYFGMYIMMACAELNRMLGAAIYDKT